jgi:ABC-type multidrug transport system ATPase subunit
MRDDDLKTSHPIAVCKNGEENRAYSRSQSDQQLSSVKSDEPLQHIKCLLRTKSAMASTFPYIYEIKLDAQDGLEVKETPEPTKAMVLDPMSDRVSTILVWQNIVVSTREVKKKTLLERLQPMKRNEITKKCLLHSVSGAITGGLWAVMGEIPYRSHLSPILINIGPSGSGKSTLLNTLACRLDVNTMVEGEMRLNGAPYNNAELKRIAGYVMQDDLLNGYLTVEETLTYTARLRLPRHFTNEQCKERVEDVMNDLGLMHVRNATIGIQLKQGISGSERKRLCVGMQLLNRPQLLFLDEPTSGLDSVMALDLLHTLNRLAHGQSQEKAVTIVCSIHQPQAKIFNLFDSLILLKAGHIMYQGPRKNAMVRCVFDVSIMSRCRFSLGCLSSGGFPLSTLHQSGGSST